ncbi:hypothetical protein AVEN_95503-1 [Araneus ventricosus]|uniref:Uncharacterized protein n=1 Tax=Araneus ventricosus TaxID=182803 RepID=A0A4Y2PD49_ARAVE|nr:hypothetical protein AVEN_95503-1 [Araneus ventricosus]
MSTSTKELDYCVMEYAKMSSIIVDLRHFWTKFDKNPPHRHNIMRWVRQFEEAVYLCKGKCTERTKSSRRASAQQKVPQTIMHVVLRKNLKSKPFIFQMVQTLKGTK